MINDSSTQYVYKLYTIGCDNELKMVKEYAAAYQMDPDSWKPTQEEAIAYYEQKMTEYVSKSVAALREKLKDKLETKKGAKIYAKYESLCSECGYAVAQSDSYSEVATKTKEHNDLVHTH